MNKRGFNLLEVLIVVLVMAVIITVSLPFYRAFGLNQDLKAVSRVLATDLRYAQQLAVTTQVNQSVIITTSTNTYIIKNLATQATIRTVIIKNSVTIQSITDLPNNTVTFNATGAATSSGTIILKSINERQATIEIKPSGYVKLQ